MDALPQWLQPFSAPFRDALAAQLREPGTGRLACLDCDGTMWSEDLGEALLRWLAAGEHLPYLGAAPSVDDLWADYEARVHRNRADGYAWAVQCMAGLEEAQVRRWCHQLAVAWPTYRPAMVALAQGLQTAGYEVWLVSASNRWIIEAGAPFLGVPAAHVLGVEVAVEAGRLTDRTVHPVTCNAGKVEAIRARLGRLPDLAIGDSLGDLEMLSAARLPLVVGRHDKPTAELLAVAAQRGWPTHLF